LNGRSYQKVQEFSTACQQNWRHDNAAKVVYNAPPVIELHRDHLGRAGGTGQSSIPLREHRRGAKVLFCRFVLGSGSWAAWLNVWD